MATTQYWLFKTEPGSYSIDDLERDGTTFWDGIRNYQARNILRDQVKRGDNVLLYHSNIPAPAAVGVATVVKEAYPDHTQFDPESAHYDAKSLRDNPRWVVVDIRFERKFPRPVALADIKRIPALRGMVVLGNSRLSVQPVTKKQWDTVCRAGEAEG